MPRLCLFTAAVLLVACSDRPSEPPRHLLLISIDTCRVDHLSAYGYDRPTSPTLESLAADGVRFERAFCQVPDTTPSHATMLTGRYPFVHGAANGVPLREGIPTLAEILAARGYRTAAFVSGFTMTAEASGLDRGFDPYDDALDRRGTETAKEPNERRAEGTTDRALAWLSEQGEEPFFLFVHYFDPHARYDPPEPYLGAFPPRGAGRARLPLDQIPPYARIGRETDPAVFVARYDGEIRYADDQIARLLAALEDRGLREDTLICVTADHGESLTEHGNFFTHGWRLFEPSLHVPLVLSCPGRIPSGRGIDEIAGLVDLVPTLAELLAIDLDPEQEVDGRSLVAAMRGRTASRPGHAIAKTTKSLTYRHLTEERGYRDHYAVRALRFKYLHSEDGETTFLFDLERDPGELRDVKESHPAQVERLRGVLAHVLGDSATSAEFLPQASEEERARMAERLRELGYLR